MKPIKVIVYDYNGDHVINFNSMDKAIAFQEYAVFYLGKDAEIIS